MRVKQGNQKNDIIILLHKIFGGHFHDFSKFATTASFTYFLNCNDELKYITIFPLCLIEYVDLSVYPF